ncbi:uncharacterized protein LOC127647776 isoform X3 [Xyrauchen texanus]|uniref:uncharacterized protein LOC127647776 isoform X2 n=1 Tax=Xyrauchen texanus TaxID=154827 RepID=UPI0022425019|nr:uncharacterized protein LOC127647776 isoform X2 [Xyrauchen texanus]XP_051988200.1 uncharacterized protein LOC127647776 isoform X3 [Xyrauchen texanus]
MTTFKYLKMLHLSNCVLMSMLLMIADGITVKGPSETLVVPLGGSVVLPCFVDKPLLSEELEVEWRRSDTETLVHLYQDGESRPEVQQQDYHDRAHFFTDKIQHGNFSLLLNNVTAEDEGKYRCKVFSGQDSGETVVEIKHVERLIVSGSDHSISAYAGEDVTLNCSVDSRITPEEIEELSWKKTDEDGIILVLLYQNNKPLPESSHEQYRDRVEFFTDEISKGNFSLRLKSVRTEDKGVYMCQVFAGGVSANTTVELEQLGLSVLHIMVLILCITAAGAALVLCLIYFTSQKKGFIVKYRNLRKVPPGRPVVLPCFIDPHLLKKDLKVEWRRSGDKSDLVCQYPDNKSRPEDQQQDYHDRAHFFTDQIQHGNFSLLLINVTAEDKGKYRCTVFSGQDSVFSVSTDLVPRLLDSVLRLHVFLAFCPNIIMFCAFVFWGVSEGSVNETVCCCALYIVRPLMLLWAAPDVQDFTGHIKTLILYHSCVAEYVFLSAVIYSALLKSSFGKLLNYAEIERVVISVFFGIMFLYCLCKIIYILVAKIGQKRGRIFDIFDVVVDLIFEILPILQFILLFYMFGSGRAGLIIVVLLPVMLIMTNETMFYRCYYRLGFSLSVLRTVQLILMFVMNAVMMGFLIMTLETETDPIGWACVIVFLQILWTILKMTDISNVFVRLSLDFHRFVSVYLFGSVGVVLISAVALMTELILKTVNGERAVMDLRFVLFPSETLFVVSLMILAMFPSMIPKILKCLQSCQDKVRCNKTDTRSQQTQSPHNAAGSDETPGTRSNQNQNSAESHETSALTGGDLKDADEGQRSCDSVV